MTAEEHLEALRSVIDRFKEEYEDAVASTLKSREELELTTKELEKLNITLKEREAEVAKAIITLDTDLKTKEDAVKAVAGEEQRLLNENATLKIENARLDDENRKYRAYEAQASKVLNAKDESLKARAKEITETELLLANKASFLPKNN